MISWIAIIDFMLIGALLVTMMFGIAFSVFMPTLNRWSKRYFITLFSLLLLCTVSCLLALLFWRDPSKIEATRITYIFEGLLMSIPVFMPTFFLLHQCGENIKNSLLVKFVAALMGVYVIIAFVSPFTRNFYYVTPENDFVRGPFYAICLIPVLLIMILNVAAVIRRKDKLSKSHYTALLIYLLPMTASMIVHMFISIEIIIVFGMALLAMIMFGLILKNNMEQYARQQQEIAHQRASVMVLQMRPHFIYNTMTTIYYLCKQDADKAQQVTLYFTDYLRQNFTAIASENPVPFAEELKHAQAYLAVEKAQHDDILVVEYDTPFTQFRLPPLTLQPIVENAVKHGMDPDADALNIFIRTRQTSDGVTVTVEDTGKGFREDSNNEPHIALDNIRERLEMMCGGTLSCESTDNGTTVTLFVPDRK